MKFKDADSRLNLKISPMKNVLIAMDGSKQSVFAFNRKYIYLFYL